MSDKNAFRYKNGRTVIISDHDNKAAILLAYLNTTLYYLRWFFVAWITIHQFLSR